MESDVSGVQTLEEMFDGEYVEQPWWHDAIAVGIPLLGVIVIFVGAWVVGR